MTLYLASLEADHASIWRAESRLTSEKRTRKPLISQNGTVYSAEGRFLPTVWRNSSLFMQATRRLKTSYRDVSLPPLASPPPFDREDSVSSICHLNCRRVPGSDRIGAAAKQNLSAAPPALNISSSCITLASSYTNFPVCGKQPNVIMNPKPRKSSVLPERYRPILLLLVVSHDSRFHGRYFIIPSQNAPVPF